MSPTKRLLFPRLVLVLSMCTALSLCGQERWIGSWAASQQRPEPQNSLSADDLRDATVRQVVHLSVGGRRLRLRLSNRFGTAPLQVRKVHMAEARAAGSIRAQSDTPVTFSGQEDVTIPAGADYISDAIDYSANPLSDLAISIYFDAPPVDQTGHPGSRATSFLVHGDAVSSEGLANAKRVEHWYFISGIDVVASGVAFAIATLGDSITDGHGATTDGNDRWPDVLAKRLQSSAATKAIAVLNQGIGGNRLLLDGLGPNALARFDPDVLAQPGIRYLMVLEGINDIGTLTRTAEVSATEHENLVHRMEGAYEQTVLRAHAHGIKVIGCTILPFVGSDYYHPGPGSEADRQTVNKWIRTSGHFDAVIDFDRVMRDPEHPERMSAKYDSGDGLHPSPAGYAAMANSIPLSLFKKGNKR